MGDAQINAVATWLTETGIDGGDELPAVLAKCCGGLGIQGLHIVNEAELMLACGRIGFKGLKLRKLLAAVKTSREGAMPAASSSSRSHDSGTGGGAFDILVARDGPPPPSPRSASETPSFTPRSEAPVFTPRGINRLPLSLAPTSIPTPPPPPVFTPRTSAEVRAAFGEDVVITPRKVETAKAVAAAAEADTLAAQQLAQALDEDEAMALKLQAELDNASSEAVARMALDDAKAQKVKKGKPAKKKKASPKTSPPKGKAASNGKAAETVASFSVDVGTTKLTVQVSKAMMSTSLVDALVAPVITNYLADKPACVRMPLGAHPEDVDVIIDGAIIDTSSAVKTHVGSSLQPVPAMFVLPRWAVDVITRAPGFLAEILIDEGETKADFHVDLLTPYGEKAGFETQCTLNAEWLAKPVRDAIVAPALEAHARCSPHAQSASAAEVTITVDDKGVDGSRPASEYLRPDGMPPLVAIWLPVTGLRVDVRMG